MITQTMLEINNLKIMCRIVTLCMLDSYITQSPTKLANKNMTYDTLACHTVWLKR